MIMFKGVQNGRTVIFTFQPLLSEESLCRLSPIVSDIYSY
jgi:hypothetical protein